MDYDSKQQEEIVMSDFPVTHAIISTNTNRNYIEYWQHISKVYKSIFNIEVICPFVYKDMKEYEEWMPKLTPHGTVLPLKAVDGIDTGNQAKLSRMFVAGKYYKDKVVVLNDMDLIPLTHEWYTKKIVDNWKDNHILCIGSECYENTADKGKFPMSFLTTQGSTMQEIINPKSLEWEDYIRQFVGMKDIDAKENVKNPWHKFSDESVLRAMMKRWNQPEREIRVKRWDDGGNSVRFNYMVCRATMHEFKPERLEEGKYAFYHAPHPYQYDKVKDFLADIDKRYGL